jgi:hypothetical protein
MWLSGTGVVSIKTVLPGAWDETHEDRKEKPMKRHIFMVVAVFCMLFAGCATTDAPNQPACTIYEDVGATPENSVIAKLIKDPCMAQRILATAAKAPIIWSPEYVGMFESWADKIQIIIEAGVSYNDLQIMVVTQIAKLNREAGLALLIVSDGIFVFDGHTEVIGEVDKKLLLMSLEDLRAKVKKLGVLNV